MKALRKLIFALAGFVAVAAAAAENYSVQRRYLSADRSRYVDEDGRTLIDFTDVLDARMGTYNNEFKRIGD